MLPHIQSWYVCVSNNILHLLHMVMILTSKQHIRPHALASTVLYIHLVITTENMLGCATANVTNNFSTNFS